MTVEEDIKLMQEVLGMDMLALRQYALERARIIARETSGDSWDDPEEWMGAAAELAHAVVRMSQLEAYSVKIACRTEEPRP